MIFCSLQLLECWVPRANPTEEEGRGTQELSWVRKVEHQKTCAHTECDARSEEDWDRLGLGFPGNSPRDGGLLGRPLGNNTYEGMRGADSGEGEARPTVSGDRGHSQTYYRQRWLVRLSPVCLGAAGKKHMSRFGGSCRKKGL